MTELRQYQRDVIVEYDRAIEAGKRRIILVAPTGSGKTIIGASIIKTAIAAGKRVLVLAHTREIIKQTSHKLSAYEIEHGIIVAGLVATPDEPVQIASIQTLWTRAMRLERMALPPADLLIIDECHHCPANTYRKIIAEYPNAILLGLSATPTRGDGRGLGGIFSIIIECPQVAELIEQKFLVRTRVFAPVAADIAKGVESRLGDYVETQLAERMDRDNLVGDIVTHWHKYGERRKTVCFAVNVAHSLHIRNEFIRSGVRAEHVDGAVPKPERDAILARLENGTTELVANCQVLGEGWDLPEVSCCILARPTRKMGLFRQMIGRVLRPADGKTNAIVLDHSGAVFRHGFVEDHVEWLLDPDRRSESPTHSARLRSGYSSRLLECTQCASMRIAGEACPHCGFLPQRPPRNVAFKDGDLAFVDRNSRTAQAWSDPAERMRWFAMLTHIGLARGHKMPGFARAKYKEKFGTWPPYGVTVAPIMPTLEVSAWVRSRAIAWARSQNNPNNQRATQ
jgi:DNA repair protein RadD